MVANITLPPPPRFAQYTKSENNNTHFARLRSHFLSGISLAACLAFISGCSTAKTGSDEDLVSKKTDQELSSVVQDGQRIPEEEFLLNEDIVSRVSTGCKGNPVEIRHTPYGKWIRHTNCYIRINGNYAPLQEISILMNSDSSKVEGYSALITKDEEHRKHLLDKYGVGTVSRSDDTCSRVGELTLPILKVVTSKHCDALTYNLL